VAAGNNHSLFLCERGRVYSCGCNDGGQLGNGRDKSLRNVDSVPTLVLPPLACSLPCATAAARDRAELHGPETNKLTTAAAAALSSADSRMRISSTAAAAGGEGGGGDGGGGEGATAAAAAVSSVATSATASATSAAAVSSSSVTEAAPAFAAAACVGCNAFAVFPPVQQISASQVRTFIYMYMCI